VRRARRQRPPPAGPNQASARGSTEGRPHPQRVGRLAAQALHVARHRVFLLPGGPAGHAPARMRPGRASPAPCRRARSSLQPLQRAGCAHP
jgi:hypothetical protein